MKAKPNNGKRRTSSKPLGNVVPSSEQRNKSQNVLMLEARANHPAREAAGTAELSRWGGKARKSEKTASETASRTTFAVLRVCRLEERSLRHSSVV